MGLNGIFSYIQGRTDCLMEPRPRIKIELSRGDRLMEILATGMLLALWVITISGYTRLPERIPSHFNAAGEADRFDHKATIFILPIVASFIFFGMTLLNRFPHMFNYPATITEQNAESMYRSATRLIRILKLVIVVVFLSIVLMVYKAVWDGSETIGPWFLPAMLVLIMGPTIFFIVKMMRKEIG